MSTAAVGAQAGDLNGDGDALALSHRTSPLFRRVVPGILATLVATSSGAASARWVGQSPDPTSPDHFLYTIGDRADAAGAFERPRGVAAGDGGTVIVADAGNHRLQVFDAVGDVIGVWGGLGSAEGRFQDPRGVAIAPDGSLFVADTANRRVQRFASNGRFIAVFSDPGDEPGRFEAPYDVAVGQAAAGAPFTVYVVDAGNHRVERLMPDGTPIGSWGGLGSEPGRFDGPEGIAVSPAGRVHVTDAGNGRVQLFEPDGTFVTVWDAAAAADGGRGPGFDHPSGIAVAPDDTVYVTDLGLKQVVHLSPEGRVLRVWGTSGEAAGQFASPEAIAVAPDGSVVLADSGNHRVTRYAAEGDLPLPIGDPNVALGRLGGLAVAADGTVFALDEVHSQVVRIGPDGRIVERIGGHGSGRRQFEVALMGSSIVRGLDGSLYIADTGNGRVQQLDAAGGYLREWSVTGDGAGRLTAPARVSVARDGSVWVLDPQYPGGTGNVVHHYGPDGTPRGEWGKHGYDDATLDRPAGLAVLPDGNVYIIDRRNKIKRFSPSGAPLGAWSCQCGTPMGLAAGPGGTLYALDGANRWVLWFDPVAGMQLIERLGGYGNAEDQFYEVRGHAVDPGGRLYIVDWYHTRFIDQRRIVRFGLGNHAVEWVWRAPEEPVPTFELTGPAGVAVGGLGEYGGGGGVFVADTGGNRVVRFERSGVPVLHWGSVSRERDVRFTRPEGVDVAPNGSVFVANTGQGLVQWYLPDGTAIGGTPWDVMLSTFDLDVMSTGDQYDWIIAHDDTVSWWGTGWPGEFEGHEFQHPRGVALAPDERSGYVADQGTHQITRVDQDGKVLGSWGGPGQAPGHLRAPEGVAVGPDGLVLVADTGNDRVQRFTANGTPLAAWGSSGMLKGEMRGPRAVDVDEDGRIYVADSGNDRIQVFGPERLTGWRVTLFANPHLAESVIAVTQTEQLRFDWGEGRPHEDAPPDGFSLEARNRVSTADGASHMTVRAAGGVRLWVEERLLVDQWQAGWLDVGLPLPQREAAAEVDLSYVNRRGYAYLSVSFTGDGTPTPTVAVPTPTGPVPSPSHTPTRVMPTATEVPPTPTPPAGMVYLPWSAR